MSLLAMISKLTTTTCTGSTSPRMSGSWARSRTFPLRTSSRKVRYTTCKTSMIAIYCQRCSHIHTNMSLESSQIRPMLTSPNNNSNLWKKSSSYHNQRHRTRRKATTTLLNIWTNFSNHNNQLRMRIKSPRLRKMQLPR